MQEIDPHDVRDVVFVFDAYETDNPSKIHTIIERTNGSLTAFDDPVICAALKRWYASQNQQEMERWREQCRKRNGSHE